MKIFRTFLIVFFLMLTVFIGNAGSHNNAEAKITCVYNCHNGQQNVSVQFGTPYRCCTVSPYGWATSFPVVAPTPNPYPSYPAGVTPGNSVAVYNYCYGMDASGNSIAGSYPLDAFKLQNLLDLGSSWTRTDINPNPLDNTEAFGFTSYNMQLLDSGLCAQFTHGIVPEISIEMGSVVYYDNSQFQPHYRYDTPAQFATLCGNLAAHSSSIFGTHLYSIPGNEINGLVGIDPGYNSVVGGVGGGPYGGVNGAPPVPVPIPGTGGSLPANTLYNAQITGIVGGVETIASPSYPENVTTGASNTKLTITWGPLAAETGGYNIYIQTGGSGSFLKVGSVAHGVLTFTYSTTGTPTGTPPATSSATIAAFEADYVAYDKACYSAIKIADPAAFIYGLEINDSNTTFNGIIYHPNTFVSDLKAKGCGPGTCYDGISDHVAFPNPLPALSISCFADGGSQFDASCLFDLEVAAGGNITSGGVPLMLGEYTVSVGAIGTVLTDAAGANAIVNDMNQLLAIPYIRYINYSNLDEDPLYIPAATNYYYNGGLVTPLTTTSGYTLPLNEKNLRWQAMKQYFTPPLRAVGN